MAHYQERPENFATILKPFHDRATLAEARLEKLEADLDAQKELKAKLETSKAEQLAEREKAAKALATLSVEKEKLQYQIVHLKRSLEEADKKLLQQSAASN